MNVPMRFLAGLTKFAFAALLVGLAGISAKSFADPIPVSMRLHRGVNAICWFQCDGSGALADSDIAFLRNEGFDHVRLAIDPENVLPPYRSSDQIVAEMQAIHSAVDRLVTAGLAVVVDVHPWDTQPPKLFATDATTAQFVAMWGQLAHELRDTDPGAVYFEIMNEPTADISDARWYGIQASALAAIRRESSVHTVIVTPPSFSTVDALMTMAPLNDANVVYTFHFYKPATFINQGFPGTFSPSWLRNLRGVDYPSYLPDVTASVHTFTDPEQVAAVNQYIAEGWDKDRVTHDIARAAGWATFWRVKLWLGEFAAMREGVPAAGRARWLRDVRSAAEKFGIGWSMWSYSDNFGTGLRIGVNDGEPQADPSALAALVGPWPYEDEPVAPFRFAAAAPASVAEFTGDPNWGSTAVLATDLDRDGRKDLVVAYADWPDNQDHVIKLLVNQGGGFFVDGSNLILGTAPSVQVASTIVAGNFDRSGRTGYFFPEDTTVENRRGGQSKLLLPAGSGQWQDASANLPRQSAVTADADAGDVDGDGVADLIVFREWQPSPRMPTQLLMNDGTGRFNPDTIRLPAWIIDTTQGQNVFLTGKFIRNASQSLPDIVLIGDNNTRSVVLANDGHGNFSEKSTLPPKPFAGNACAKSVAVGDVNKDGRADLVVAYVRCSPWGDSAVQLLIAKADGLYEDETADHMTQPAPGHPIRSVILIDNPVSGLPDLLLQYNDGSLPTLKANLGGGKYSDVPVDAFVSGNLTSPAPIAIADFDNDGRLDMLSTGAAGHFEINYGAQAAVVNYQGLWWASPPGSESGWGINFAHQSDIIFATWFTYDATGKAWWLSMTATRTGANTYGGDLLTTHGPAFSATPFDPNAVTHATVGHGTLTFTDLNTAQFSYTVNGIAQVKTLTRELFGTAPACAFGAQSNLALATNYQDLWWAAPAGIESGWGINLTEQSNEIFGTWFTYDTDGSPLWLTVLATSTAPNVYSGALYRMRGPAFSAVPFDPAQVTPTQVGTATFTFSDGAHATFAYTLSGVSQAKAITREVFVSPGTMCQ